MIYLLVRLIYIFVTFIFTHVVPATVAKNGSEFISSAAKNKKRRERQAKLKEKQLEADPKAAELASRHPQAKWTRTQREAAKKAGQKPVDSSSDSDHSQGEADPKRQRAAGKAKPKKSTKKQPPQPEESTDEVSKTFSIPSF